MFQKMKTHPIIKGTVILTLTGLITRIMGFYFRIFLSHTFGEEGVGLYQLIFPIYALCFSLTSAGLQLSLSRYVAKEMSLNRKDHVQSALLSSLCISFILSFFSMLFLQHYASFLSQNILHESRCDVYLRILSYALPFSSIHSCIIGYYLGIKSTKIPAFLQLIEQSMRILSVYVLYLILKKQHITYDISIAVIGLVVGEFTAAFCGIKFLKKTKLITFPKRSFFSPAVSVFKHALPLTTSRVMLNILQGIEAISIPLKLQLYGYCPSQALSIYGVLTGMALPFILFPSSLTNSISTMLLPTVAEIHTNNKKESLKKIIRKSLYSCLFLGFLCMFVFLLTGNFLGTYIFHSSLAGTFIVVLSFMCPFLYTNTSLLSILNGMGHILTTFCINMLSIFIRVISVLFFIPKFGIYGYLVGLLASQIFMFTISIFLLMKNIKNN